MQNQNERVYEQIDDYKKFTVDTTQQSYVNEIHYPEIQETQQTSEKIKKIQHQAMGQSANRNFQVDQQDGTNIKIGIKSYQTMGGPLSKYTVYIIRGEDKNGQINVSRRFKQFFEMRLAMIKRWPGCFIPSIPGRNALNKNDLDVILYRQRYLNDFVKKVARLPYLYYGQEFQTLIRSQQSDISSLFEKWPKPTFQQIITKYRQTFNELNGKQINADTNSQIANFYIFIKKNTTNLEKYSSIAKKLAQSRDRLDKSYGVLFSEVFPTYERICLHEYAQGREKDFLYLNPSEARLAEHSTIVVEAVKKNSYWLLFDMIQNQQRDGRAFLEALNVREALQSKKHSIEGKIRDNQRTMVQISSGKKSLALIIAKGTDEQIKYKLQIENGQLKNQKQHLLVLTDIVTALIVYIEIAKYKRVKSAFYESFLMKLSGYEVNMVSNLEEVWMGTKKVLQNRN